MLVLGTFFFFSLRISDKLLVAINVCQMKKSCVHKWSTVLCTWAWHSSTFQKTSPALGIPSGWAVLGRGWASLRKWEGSKDRQEGRVLPRAARRWTGRTLTVNKQTQPTSPPQPGHCVSPDRSVMIWCYGVFAICLSCSTTSPKRAGNMYPQCSAHMTHNKCSVKVHLMNKSVNRFVGKFCA